MIDDRWWGYPLHTERGVSIALSTQVRRRANMSTWRWLINCCVKTPPRPLGSVFYLVLTYLLMMPCHCWPMSVEQFAVGAQEHVTDCRTCYQLPEVRDICTRLLRISTAIITSVVRLCMLLLNWTDNWYRMKRRHCVVGTSQMRCEHVEVKMVDRSLCSSH